MDPIHVIWYTQYFFCLVSVHYGGEHEFRVSMLLPIIKGRKNGTDGAHIDSLKGRFQSHRGLNDGVQFNVYTNVVVKVPSNSGVVEGEKLTVHCQVVGPEAEANALQQISNKTELGKSELIRIPSKSHKVHCTEDAMRVEIALPAGKANDTNIYLEGLKGYPDERCKPKVNETWAEFKLSLEDFYDCGITRMVNKLTGKKVYYHKIIIEEQDGKEIVSVKCITTGPIYNVLNRTHAVSKRDVLPAGFQEAEDLDITMSYTKNAPEPIIDVGVRQGGQRVTGELNVSPGTPLTMEIFLDETSSPVYGLGVTYMEVTDTKNQEETIIFNGCSIDPYLFENFNTVDGDFLSAKFRAFKFPESTYVQFRATVNVCLDKCQGTPCSNGQIGYGRRRREIRQNGDPNKVYEFSLATFIKVDDIEGIKKGEILELEEKLRQLQLVNQKLARNSRGSASENDRTMPARDSATVVEEETLLKIAAASSSKGLLVCSPIALSLVTAIKLIL